MGKLKIAAHQRVRCLPKGNTNQKDNVFLVKVAVGSKETTNGKKELVMQVIQTTEHFVPSSVEKIRGKYVEINNIKRLAQAISGRENPYYLAHKL